MIHVLHVLHGLARGGAERVTASLIAATDKSRFRHSLCYLYGDDDLADEIRASGCEVVCLDAPRRLPWITGVRALRRELRRLQPDVIHSSIFEPNIASRIAALGLGIPHINWLVSMEYDPASVRAAGWSRGNNQLRRIVDALTARLTRARFIACSHAVARSAIERLRLPASRFEVIYNPVALADLSATPPEVEGARSSLNIGASDFIWLSIGRQDRAKGHHLLIEAFAEIARRSDHLILIGRGPASGELVAQAERLSVRERVHFLPSVPKIGPYLHTSNAFVFPSLIEGLPVALLEAMCASLPCIASDIPPHTEVITDGYNGVIVTAGSSGSLANAMTRLADDEDLRRLIAAQTGSESRNRFGSDQIIPAWEAAYAKTARATRSLRSSPNF